MAVQSLLLWASLLGWLSVFMSFSLSVKLLSMSIDTLPRSLLMSFKFSRILIMPRILFEAEFSRLVATESWLFVFLRVALRRSYLAFCVTITLSRKLELSTYSASWSLTRFCWPTPNMRALLPILRRVGVTVPDFGTLVDRSLGVITMLDEISCASRLALWMMLY